MGVVEELGSGMRKMFKYTPLYANGKEPIIEEQDVYHIEIPYIPTLQGSDIDTTQNTTVLLIAVKIMKRQRDKQNYLFVSLVFLLSSQPIV